MKIDKNQSGFSAVEAVLIIVILAIVGGAGWYVWKVNHSNALPTASSVSSGTIKKPVTPPKTDQSNPKDNDSVVSSTPTSQVTYLGIGFTTTDSLKDLTYSSRTSETADGIKMLIVDVSTDKLVALDPECAAKNATALGAITKVDGQYPTEPSSDTGSLVKQFAKYYIAYSRPQAYCSQKQEVIDLIEAQIPELKAALASVKEL